VSSSNFSHLCFILGKLRAARVSVEQFSWITLSLAKARGEFMNRSKEWMSRLPICHAVALTVLFAASVLTAQGQVAFAPPQNIGGSQIAVDPSGNIDVLSAGGSSIYFTRSTDGGNTFSTPITWSAQGNVSTARIAVDSSRNIDVVWTANGGFCCSGIAYFAQSTDGGASFSAPVSLSQNPVATDPQMVVDSQGNIYVAWITITSSSFGEYYVTMTRSTNGGSSFSSPNQIGGDLGGTPAWYLAADSSGNAYVLSSDNGIYLDHTSDGGTTVSQTTVSSSPGNIDPGQMSGSQARLSPMVIDASGNIDVIWGQGTSGGTQVYFFSRSTNQGAGFSAPVAIGTTSEGQFGQIFVSPSGTIFAAYYDGNPNAWNFWLTQSTDGGNTFSAPKNILSAGNIQGAFDSDGNLNVLGSTSNMPQQASQLFWSVSTDGGNTFLTPQDISTFAGNATFALDSRDNAYVLTNGTFTRSIRLVSLTLNPSSVPGGSDSTGTLTLSGPAFSGGAAIDVSNSNWNVANIPGPMTIPEGQTAATFGVETNTVSQPSSTTITAQYAGASLPATLTVDAASLTDVSVSPSRATGGSSPTGTVSLNVDAPGSGTVVSLSSSNPGVANVPSSVTVQWSTSATFAVSTAPVSQSTPVTVSASSGGVNVNTTVIVVPPVPASMSVDQPNPTGGSGCTGGVFLNGNAPSGGALVSLSSSDPAAASVPSAVPIQQGANSAYFSISTQPVSQPTGVAITATYQGTSVMLNITVQP
jgi:hypothetical protein